MAQYIVNTKINHNAGQHPRTFSLNKQKPQTMNTPHTTPIDTRPMFETFLEYINGDLTISEMADKYGVNPIYLEAVIKYGGSQYEYQQMIKQNELIWQNITILQKH